MVDTIAALPALWRRRDEDNGEAHTDFDKGYEQASDECADTLERAIAALEASPGVVDAEAAAAAVYAQMPYEGRGATGVKPAWQPRGNSIKQDEARRYAHAALAAAPKPSDAVDSLPFLGTCGCGLPARYEAALGGLACNKQARCKQADPAPSVSVDGVTLIPLGNGSTRVIIQPQTPSQPPLTDDEVTMLQMLADHARIVAEKDQRLTEALRLLSTRVEASRLDEANAMLAAAEARADALAGVLRECASWLGCAGVPRDLRLRIAAQLSEGRP